MEIHKMAGWCLILFGVINVLHKVHLNEFGGDEISTMYKFVTALLFATGAALLWSVRKSKRQT